MNVEDDLEGLPLNPRGWAAAQIWIGRVPPSVVRVVGALAALAAIRSGFTKSYWVSAAETVVFGFTFLMRLDQIKTKAQKRGIQHADPLDPLFRPDDQWDE